MIIAELVSQQLLCEHNSRSNLLLTVRGGEKEKESEREGESEKEREREVSISLNLTEKAII